MAEQIRAARTALIRRIEGRPEALLRQRPSGDEWSAVEIVAHLAAVDLHWLAQAIALLQNSAHVFVPFDDEAWKANHPRVRDQPIDTVLRTVAASHSAVLAALSALNAADLERPGRHPRGIPYTAGDVFRRYLTHDRAHADQISNVLD